MAGHSKWANIQHRKKRQDDKRGKLFSKLIREVMVAAKTGGADPADNARLRLAVDKAMAANMPKDTVERAIKRGSGDDDSASYEEIRYEGYGPGGVAVLIDCLSDNRNRTVSDVRHTLGKHGGTLGNSGSVTYLFSTVGVLSYAPGTDADSLMDRAVEAGAEDLLVLDDDSVEVLTQPQDFMAVRQNLSDGGQAPDHAEVTLRAQTQVALEGDEAQKLLKLVDSLEELDDVQAVYTNASVPDSAYAD